MPPEGYTEPHHRELPGERSSRILQQLREQEELDTAEALGAWGRRFKDEYPLAEREAYIVGYKHAIQDQRRRLLP